MDIPRSIVHQVISSSQIHRDRSSGILLSRRHAIRSADSAKNGRSILPRGALATNFTEFLPTDPAHNQTPIWILTKTALPIGHSQPLLSPALGSPQPSLIGKTLQQPYIHPSAFFLRLWIIPPSPHLFTRSVFASVKI